MSVRITQKEGEEIPTEVLATEIMAISAGIKKLRSGRLNEDALILLIQHASPSYGGKYARSRVGKNEIKAVLDGMTDLERAFIRKPQPR